MGGGGAMRAAAKVAGIGVVNSGIRSGISGLPLPAEQSVRNASLPVSAIISSKASEGEVAAAVQRPAWELDDWEFAGGFEDEMALGSAEPVARVVFGGPPSLQEAVEATCELKDALQKVYLSSSHSGSGRSLGGSQLSGTHFLANSDHLETKACVNSDTIGPPVPKYAMKAFSLLNESPKIQTVVAEVVSDKKVWKAVWENEALQDLLLSLNTTKGSVTEAQSFEAKESVGDADFKEAADSQNKFIELSDDESEDRGSQNEFTDILNNVKHTVVDMVTNLSSYFQKIFSFSHGDNTAAADDDEGAGSATIGKTLGASVMALSVMVIMVVVLRRS